MVTRTGVAIASVTLPSLSVISPMPIVGFDRLHLSRAAGRMASSKQQEPFQMFEQLNRTDGFDHIAVTRLARGSEYIFSVA